jgi:hypothetical protein
VRIYAARALQYFSKALQYFGRALQYSSVFFRVVWGGCLFTLCGVCSLSRTAMQLQASPACKASHHACSSFLPSSQLLL